MHRSSSSTRASEEFCISVDTVKALPNDVTISESERKRHKVPGENAVHLIPLVLLLCGLILWLGSHPVDVASSDDTMAVMKLSGDTTTIEENEKHGITGENPGPGDIGKSKVIFSDVTGERSESNM